MNREEAVSLIKQHCGYRKDLDASIVNYLKIAQTTLEREPTLPWFLLSEDSTVVVDPGDERITIPEDFLREFEEGALVYLPDDPECGQVSLVKKDWDYLDRKWGRTATGSPVHYALTGKYFRIKPIPDKDYTVRLLYYKKADELVGDSSTNVWLEHVPRLLCGAAGLLLAPSLRDKDATATFADWVKTERLLMHGDETARDLANRHMQIGGPH
jgi:hypothetical protein